jgi:hypothetical protein
MKIACDGMVPAARGSTFPERRFGLHRFFSFPFLRRLRLFAAMSSIA